MEQLEKIKASINDFLENQVAKWDIKIKIAILAGTIILIIAAFIFLVWNPKTKQIKQLEKQNSFLQGEIAKVEAIANQLAEHKAEMERVDLQLKAASQLLPQKKEIPSLLTNISEQGTASGLDFVSFQPAPEKPAEFYAEIPVNISVRGSYHQVGNFLDKISKLNRIVTVNNITMGSPQKQDGKMMLNTSFNLVTYRFIEPSEQAENQKQQGRKGRR